MLECSICKTSVSDLRGLASHFRHQASTHPDYSSWSEEQKWSGKVVGQDYVRCLECGFRSESLARHLKAAHAITADQYRERNGEAAPIRCGLTEARRRSGIKQSHALSPRKGLTKISLCETCAAPVEVSRFSSEKGVICPACADLKWKDKTEPEDYVTCLDCGYRAENLTSHFQNSHPDYRTRYPDALVNALKSGARYKGKIKGRTLSAEVRAKMSERAGRWNKGLTKETHPSLKAASEKMQGKPSWCKGLTEETSEAILRRSDSLRAYFALHDIECKNGLKANLTPEDYELVLDAEGRVDRKKAMGLIEYSWNTIRKYMREHGLEISDVNVKACQEASAQRLREFASQKLVKLTAEQLEPYRLTNGKLVVAWAASRLGYGVGIIRREADRLGIPRFQWGLSQGLCLGTVSEALGGAEWVSEWQSRKFTNPESSYMYKFDGFFPAHNLIVEYHGYQHFVWPNAFYPTEESYLSLRRRDAHKRELVAGDPKIKYLEVRFDEPFDDVSYIRGRLFQLGVGDVNPPPPDTLDLFGC